MLESKREKDEEKTQNESIIFRMEGMIKIEWERERKKMVGEGRYLIKRANKKKEKE